jgi:uncharacterized protein (TIGR03084 family)
MPIEMRTLCTDLQAETDTLHQMLDSLTSREWQLATPSPGWSVADQVTHLAYFDEAVVRAITEPEAFLREREHALADVDTFTDEIARRYRNLSSPEIRTWFDLARKRLVEVFTGIEPSARVHWYGPDFSAASALTARIMETWAHGQDVADALGVQHPSTSALRHVAHIGVSTFANSFRAHGLGVPDADVYVSLVAPEGGKWEWGTRSSEDRVLGSALEFCLVVTQRRHLADTNLEITGETARTWMEHAQAFAGPPGPGRKSGQFA